MNVLVKKEERIDDLQTNGLKIIQNPNGFCFGIDAVLLSNFARVSCDDTVVDLGTGTGVIALLVAGKSKAKKIYGIEIQHDVANMAMRSVKLNHLESRVQIIDENLVNVTNHIQKESVNVVISNPPYMPIGTGDMSPTRSVSRHEVSCTLEQIVSVSADILKTKGRFYMVHRPQRLVDVITVFRKYNVEPKLLQFVHPFANKEANLFLIQGTKGGGKEVRTKPPLVVRNAKGEYTEDIYEIYRQVNIDTFKK